MILVFVFVFTCYAVLIIALSVGFFKIKYFEIEKTTPTTQFSVLIPFRNEAKNLPNLLKSILTLDYPKSLVEFIFINDASTDDSVAIIKSFSTNNKNNIQIIENNRTSNSPKKDAITTAINFAKNNWLVTTDADCTVPKNWLLALHNFIIDKQPKMVVAPVNYKVKNTFLEQFQLLDFMSLQGTTIGAFGMQFPFLCNGANLAYQKEEFLKLNGFVGNNQIASGDDIFLFEKFLENDKKSVHYLKSKDAIVTTLPVKTWKDLIHQRIRWATKTSHLKSIKVKAIGFLVFFVNLMVVFSFLLLNDWAYILLPLGLKIIIDLFLFIPTISFYGHKKSFIKWYLCSSILYPFFSVFIVLKSLFTNYNWKGRTFKK